MTIDGAILYFTGVFFMIIGMIAFWNGAMPQGGFQTIRPGSTAVYLLMTWFLAAFLFNMLYFTYFHGTCGQTPGKMLLRIRVEQIDGEEMTLGLGFLRWVGYIISSLPLYLGFLWVGLDPRKRGWHDRIAGTVVVIMKIDDADVPLGSVMKDDETDEKSLDNQSNIL